MDKKPHILLLVDDNPLLVGMYKTLFEKKGFEVFFAHDGVSGLQLAKQKNPELIILDILMPGMDGFQILEELKASQDTKHIKVVVLTVVAGSEFEKKARDLGAADYLIKSELKLNEIAEKVLAHLPEHMHK
jgi:DNA-binding response OmpR family regulator